MQKLEERRPKTQEQRKVSTCWKKSCLIHSKNFKISESQIQIQTHWMKPDLIKRNKKCMKFDSLALVLNPLKEV